MAAKPSARKAVVKKSPTPVKKAAASKKAPAKKVVGKKVVPKKAAPKKAAAPAKKAAALAKKAPAKKVVATKAPVKKASVKKAPAKKVVATKAPVKKAPAKKVVATKAPVKKAPAKKVVATKAPVKKAPVVKVPPKPPVDYVQAPHRVLEVLTERHKKLTGPPVSDATLVKLKELLREDREHSVVRAEQLTAEADSLVKDRELGDTQFDEESGEGDTISIAREIDLTLAATNADRVFAIDAALERMVNGTYGYCTACSERIPVARLEVAPEADMCVKCKSRGERRR